MLLALLLASLQEARTPVPEEADTRNAEKTIRAIFQADYSRRDKPSRQALAVKLLGQAASTRDDPAAHFVLLREARDLSVRVGDIDTALEAVRQMAATFDVPILELKSKALADLRRTTSTPAGRSQLARALLDLAGEAIESNEFDVALKAARSAQSSARIARESALADEAGRRLKSIPTLKRMHQAAATAEVTLSVDPDDPEANLVVGRYACFAKNDWPRGLPFLAKGSDSVLKEAASKELEGTGDSTAQVKIAESWLAVAKKKRGNEKTACQSRALHWFQEALPKLSGLMKFRVETALNALYEEPGLSTGMPAGLLFWIEPGRNRKDPFQDLRFGLRGTNNGAQPVTGATPAIEFTKNAVVYDAAGSLASFTRSGTVLAWFKTDDVSQFGNIVNRSTHRADASEDFGLYVRSGHLNAYINWEPPNKPSIGSSRGALANGKWILGGFTWDKKSLTFYIDGRKDKSIPLNGNIPQARGAKVVLGVSVPGGSEFFRGQLAALWIFDRTLTEAEIGRIHTTTRGRMK